VILATLNPGDYIGEMSLIDNEPHSATCRAEVQTDMLTLGRAEFARCLPENSSMSYAIMKGWCSACARPTARSSRWR
jgi:CRP/FNR family cyclic AMP-dependent transcriptional regulator